MSEIEGQQSFAQNYPAELKLWNQHCELHNITMSQQCPQPVVLDWLTEILNEEMAEPPTSYKSEMDEYMKAKQNQRGLRFEEAIDLLNWARIRYSKQQQANNEEKEQGSQQEFKLERQQELQHKEELNTQQQYITQQDNNQFNETNTQNKKLPINNYQDNLRVVFDHYCRMSCGAGNDPTFQQIQQKTHVMTMNKFMIFCKEFGLTKLKPLPRNCLVELFKKNSEFHKEMNFRQFLQVLVKTSRLVYGQQGEEVDEDSPEFEKLLIFLQVDKSVAFRNKLQSLNICYIGREGAVRAKKPVLSNYKFKYVANNGKSEQEVKQVVQERKRIRSENKVRINKSKKKVQVRTSAANIIKKQHQLLDYRQRPSLNSSPVGATIKCLNPPKPPPRKNVNQTTVYENQVTGYANIYKIRKGRQGIQSDSRFKLNSIVEQAKRLIYRGEAEQNSMRYGQIGTPSSSYDNGIISESRGPSVSEYSRDSQYQHVDSHRNIAPMPQKYAPFGHSQICKRDGKKASHTDLSCVLDSSSESDQYLNEHLNREKRDEGLSKRIQAKIRQINQQ